MEQALQVKSHEVETINVVHKAPLLARHNNKKNFINKSSMCNNMLLFFDYNKHNNVTVK